MVAAPPQDTPRTKIRQWVRQERNRLMDESAPVNGPSLSRQAAEYFVRADPDFAITFMSQMLRPAIYDEVLQVLGETRHFQLVHQDYEPEDQQHIPATKSHRVTKFQANWHTWLERVPGIGHLQLKDMEPEHLKLAAGDRKGRSVQEATYAGLWDTLREEMKPGQKVGDIYSNEAIQEIFESIAIDIVVTKVG